MNADGHDAVFIHLDNTPGPSSVLLPNGTELNVLGEDGDWGKGHSVEPIEVMIFMSGFLLCHIVFDCRRRLAMGENISVVHMTRICTAIRIQ